MFAERYMLNPVRKLRFATSTNHRWTIIVHSPFFPQWVNQHFHNSCLNEWIIHLYVRMIYLCYQLEDPPQRNLIIMYDMSCYTLVSSIRMVMSRHVCCVVFMYLCKVWLQSVFINIKFIHLRITRITIKCKSHHYAFEMEI